ncbi:nucleoside triphosphate pyrophosphohydrolase [Streptomyces benahoarensis]|uniref:nucleoside triphosphate pyrophosphohydrolase n=1 Tax=Streptomyces benahoarensis TaxID=2595054 RepID=UPI002035EE9D|nr:nucleoside triphosphate pyrophosphohydrolase [Streptomyces benahoarensis]
MTSSYGTTLRRGAVPDVYTASPEEYRWRLRDKLGEEVAEFLAAQEGDEALVELADVLEVVRALAADLGSDIAAVEKIRVSKARERGGFADRVILRGNR